MWVEKTGFRLILNSLEELRGEIFPCAKPSLKRRGINWTLSNVNRFSAAVLGSDSLAFGITVDGVYSVSSTVVVGGDSPGLQTSLPGQSLARHSTVLTPRNSARPGVLDQRAHPHEGFWQS